MYPRKRRQAQPGLDTSTFSSRLGSATLPTCSQRLRAGHEGENDPRHSQAIGFGGGWSVKALEVPVEGRRTPLTLLKGTRDEAAQHLPATAFPSMSSVNNKNPGHKDLKVRRKAFIPLPELRWRVQPATTCLTQTNCSSDAA